MQMLRNSVLESGAGNISNWPSRISRAAHPSASADANATTRREADNAASSGMTTSQIAAKDSMPPVLTATVMTRPASASEDNA